MCGSIIQSVMQLFSPDPPPQQMQQPVYAPAPMAEAAPIIAEVPKPMISPEQEAGKLKAGTTGSIRQSNSRLALRTPPLGGTSDGSGLNLPT